ncbi:MAG TPA: RNA ligase family protein [Acidimicrobiales bacterium]|nr:RNA ligase family protein [Acidimicrobiales bacterium]
MTKPPRVQPMLAVTGRPAGDLATYACETKHDGWRLSISLCSGELTARTRSGQILQVPALEPIAELGVDVVLDGELVSSSGRSDDFYDVVRNLGRRGNPAALAFVAFDVVWHDGQLITDWTYEQRRSLLERLELPAPASVVPRWAGTDLDDVLAACEAQGVEGVVLKQLSSRYQPGARSRRWRKVKTVAWKQHHAWRRHEHHPTRQGQHRAS